MEAVTTRGVALARGEPAVCALLAATTATLVAALGPPGGDAAAHLYRTELVRDGVAVWDNLWFGGHYPLASYSVLYYLLAAAVGNVVLVAAGAIASAALFTAIAHDEWGEAARWPARTFAILAAGSLFTGTYSYSLGIAAGLGSLRLLQLGRRWPAVAAAVVALGFSPLAFAFLAIAFAAVALARRRLDLRVAGGLAVAAAAEVALLLLFPTDGRYPFSPLSLFAAVAVSALGAGLAFRTERARALGWFFVLWAAVSLVAFAVPSPFGDNLTRLRMIVLPLVLVPAALAGFRPRWLAAAAVAFALGYNLSPDLSALPKRLADTETAEAAFWAPALEFVAERSGADHRVEVVPTFGHWEAYWVPRAGLALARGWYRQIDLAENPELYRDPLTAEAYRRWLDRMAVRFVLVPDARLGPMGASREAELLRSGRAGLRPVFRSDAWTIYEVPHPTPILAGGRLTLLGHDVVAGRVPSAGVYRLRVRWTPYWEARGACLERAEDGWTMVRARRAGAFVLEAAFPGGAACGRR